MSLSEGRCEEIAQTWFKVDGDDSSEFDGVSMGELLRLKVFEQLYKRAQVADDGLSIKQMVKRLGLDGVLRALLSFFSGDDDIQEKDYLFIYDINNKPMIDALNLLAISLVAKGESVGAVTIDHAISEQCSVKGKLTWFGVFAFADFLKVLKSFSRYFTFLKGMNECYNELELVVGRRLCGSVKRYFLCQSFFLLFERQAIESILKHKKPRVIVVASDAHRVAQMAVILGKKSNIKTIVYQHGATIWGYGYVPVYADKIMVWGESSRQWLIKREVLPSQISVVGNILMEVTKLERAYRPPELGKRIYFFPNPIDRAVIKIIVNAIDSACVKFKTTGCLKLHPSEKNVSFFKNIIKTSISELALSTCAIRDLDISLGDIAVIVNSTAGVDACLKGAVVLCVDVPGMPNSINYESAGVGVHTTIEEFECGVARALSIKIDSYKVNREEFLNDQMGNLDGVAIERAAQVLLRMKHD